MAQTMHSGVTHERCADFQHGTRQDLDICVQMQEFLGLKVGGGGLDLLNGI